MKRGLIYSTTAILLTIGMLSIFVDIHKKYTYNLDIEALSIKSTFETISNDILDLMGIKFKDDLTFEKTLPYYIGQYNYSKLQSLTGLNISLVDARNEIYFENSTLYIFDYYIILDTNSKYFYLNISTNDDELVTYSNWNWGAGDVYMKINISTGTGGVLLNGNSEGYVYSNYINYAIIYLTNGVIYLYYFNGRWIIFSTSNIKISINYDEKLHGTTGYVIRIEGSDFVKESQTIVS